MQVVGLILARGGSKGVPRKNLRLLAGTPLLVHAIRAAQRARTITRAVVSTEDPEIARLAKQSGAEVLSRPVDLAQDETGNIPVWQHSLAQLEFQDGEVPEVMVNLNPTSPLRTSEDIDATVDLLAASGADAVITVTEVAHRLDKVHRIESGGRAEMVWPHRKAEMAIGRRQDVPRYYRPNGAVTAVWSRLVMLGEGWEDIFVDGRDLRVVPMPAERSIDIDNPIDFALAEILMNKEMDVANTAHRNVA